MSDKKVLIIEDEKAISDIIKFNLTKEGFEIETAYDGEAGLKKALEWKPDLILLDIMLPIMDGFQVCKAMRADKSLDRIPVIFLSADSDREIIFNGFDIGAQDYITKPFDNRELLVKVNTLLSLKKALEKIDRLEKGTD